MLRMKNKSKQTRKVVIRVRFKIAHEQKLQTTMFVQRTRKTKTSVAGRQSERCADKQNMLRHAIAPFGIGLFTMYSRDSTESPGSSMLVSNSICNVTVRLVVPRERRLDLPVGADDPITAIATAAAVDPFIPQSLTIYTLIKRYDGPRT